MPITRTVNGFKDELSCDSVDDWDTLGSPVTVWTADTVEKKEGLASLEASGSTMGSGWFQNLVLKRYINAATGDRLHCWHKMTDAYHRWYLAVCCLDCTPCDVGPHQGWPQYVTTIISKLTGTEGWTLKKATMPCTSSAPIFYIVIGFTGSGSAINDWTDRIVISTTQYLTVAGLNPGQLVEVYRASDDVKIGEATCAGGATSVVVDVDAEDYPEYMYLKVYATDGVTLVEKTLNQLICGGDTWSWNAPLGTIAIKSASYTIYRTGSTGTPTSTLVTATLKTPAGAPYPNVTVYFRTSKGTVSAGSDVTDANGEAHTTLSSDVHGIAVVRAYWPGDASVPAAVAYGTHHVLYDLEVGDEDKKFQLYVEGIEYAYSTGSYKLSNENAPQEFSVEIPEWVSTITRRGIVSIYRKGIKEFSGILTVIDRTLADPTRVLLSGVDSKSLLDTRVVTIKDYSAQTVAYMLGDLLASFWCGVSLGTVSDYPGTLTQTFADESLGSSVARLCDIIGWQYRLTTDIKLDVKPSFGAVISTVTFVQGQNLFLNAYRVDDRQVCNSVRMRGNEDLVSTVFDGTSIEDDDLGLLEEVMFQKSIGVQATLDIAANAELARRAGQNIRIQADVLDAYDAGTWSIDDSVTLTVPEHDLSGQFKVVRIERDMTDPNVAKVDFVNKLSLEWADLWQGLRRELKDLGAKTAI